VAREGGTPTPPPPHISIRRSWRPHPSGGDARKGWAGIVKRCLKQRGGGGGGPARDARWLGTRRPVPPQALVSPSERALDDGSEPLAQHLARLGGEMWRVWPGTRREGGVVEWRSIFSRGALVTYASKSSRGLDVDGPRACTRDVKEGDMSHSRTAAERRSKSSCSPRNTRRPDCDGARG